jgi:ATP-dependent Lon protease
VSLRDRGLYGRELPSEDDFEVPAVFSEGVVLLPHMEVTMSLKESASETAIVSALATRHLVAMIPSNGYQVGDIGTLALLEEGKGIVEGTVQLKGLWRIRVREVTKDGERPSVRFQKAEDFKDGAGQAADMVTKVRGQVDEFAKLMPNVPEEVISFVKSIDSPGKLADVCAGSPMFTNEERLELLGTLDPKKRLSRVSDRMEKDLEALRELGTPKTIGECETCMDFADRAFDSEGAFNGEIAGAFLDHVVNKHPNEVLTLIAGKYGPAFMQKRSLR